MSINKSNSSLHIDLSESYEREGFVFVSYKNEEVALAEHFRIALKKAGFSVWWDRQIQCGQAWNQVLDDAVKQANCIVVLWSLRSAESKWVLHEASVALARNNYAPVRIELCSIPSPYNQIQATDIIDWDGVSDHPGVKNLLERCSFLVPKRRSIWSQLKETLWIHRVSVIGSVFGLIALAILVWQTQASRSQLQRLNAVVSQQTQSSASLDAFREQSTKDLNDFREQAEHSIMRGYYHLEPLKIEFTLEYSFDNEKIRAYVKRLRQSLKFPSDKSYSINLLHPDYKNLLPGSGPDEVYAKQQLLSDETSFDFIDLKQAIDSNSRSFIRYFDKPRGTITFSSYPKSLADAIVKIPNGADIEQEIELSADGEKFIKKVRCKHPVRTGDDVYAFSVVDLIGRLMRYRSSDGAVLKDFTFKFSFDYDSYSYLNSTIIFPEGIKEMVITPKHIGLQKYELEDSVILARKRFDNLPSPTKKAFLNNEIKNRLDFFVETFVKMENDKTWSLAEWAKVEWTAAALDGNPPFSDQTNEDKTFQGRSFKWLLAELLRETQGSQRDTITAAATGANELFELLSSIGPETSNDTIVQTLKNVRKNIFTDFGLKPWKPNIIF